MPKEMHFEATGATVTLIKELRLKLNATSDAHVMTKALALAKVIASKADADGKVTLRGKGQNNDVTISLRE